jgi:hypothetical protein
MENTKSWSIASSESHFGYKFAGIHTIFSLKLVRIPLIRTPFAYWRSVAYGFRRRVRLAQLGIFTRNLAL